MVIYLVNSDGFYSGFHRVFEPTTMGIWRLWYWLVVTGTWLDYDFPYIGNNHSNWRTHICQRGWNHQPDWIYSKSFHEFDSVNLPESSQKNGNKLVLTRRCQKIVEAHSFRSLFAPCLWGGVVSRQWLWRWPLRTHQLPRHESGWQGWMGLRRPRKMVN